LKTNQQLSAGSGRFAEQVLSVEAPVVEQRHAAIEQLE